VTYTDTTVVNDIDYYYMVQALGPPTTAPGRSPTARS